MPAQDPERDLAREDLCRYLAACYYQPGPEFAEEGLFASMHEAARRIDPSLAALARALGESFTAEGHDSLLVDYARLFLGPTEALARPYGSVWLEDASTVMGDSTLSVLAFYEEGGFEMDEEFRELPDHIAAELEFLYLLVFRENEARRAAEEDALKATARLRARFLDEHLGAWAAPFTAAVRAGAQSDFYRHLADLTGRFVAMEAAAAGSG